jgi:hypothetical protein
MKLPFSAFVLSVLACAACAQEEEYRCRLTSLFQPDRIEDFRTFMEENFPEVTVQEVSYETGVATLRFDVRKLKPFQTAKTADIARDRLSFLMRGASRGIFSLLPLSEVPAEELGEARIPVQGLDCKGCSYGAYLAMTRVDGVEYATASFKTGEVRVRFDRRKTNLPALEEALNTRSIATNYRIEETNVVPPDEMKIVRASSEEASGDEVYFHSTGLARNAIDGDPRTKWSTRYAKGEVASPPHELVIDMGKTRKVSGFRYLPRQIGYNGQFADTEFYVSDEAGQFPQNPAAKVTFSSLKCAQAADCTPPVSGRFVLVRVLSEVRGKPGASAAEIAVLQAP